MDTAQFTNVDMYRIIWERCFKKKICIKIPFDGKKCASVRACIRILHEKANYYLELQVFGGRKRVNLTNGCFDLSFGIGSVRVCVKADVSDDKISGVTIAIKLCVGKKIDGINLSKCWTVYKGRIKFLAVNSLSSSPGFDHFETPVFAEQINDSGAEIICLESAEIDMSEKDDDDIETSGFFDEDFDDKAFERGFKS